MSGKDHKNIERFQAILEEVGEVMNIPDVLEELDNTATIPEDIDLSNTEDINNT